MNDSKRMPLPAQLVWRDWGHWLAFGFGVGLLRWAPGTWGTLLAFPLMQLLWAYASTMVIGFILTGATVFGVALCQRTGRALGIPDHHGIVWDEIVAFGWVLWVVGPGRPALAVLAFLLFRGFDIFKPPPIHWVDQRWQNGFGVMLDDLVAALYTLLALAIICFALEHQRWVPLLSAE